MQIYIIKAQLNHQTKLSAVETKFDTVIKTTIGLVIITNFSFTQISYL